jgi:UDP-N-acetylglucosamine 2-epimerase (non-hydrolysing)
MKKICVVFGTRPETIKVAPVIWQLEARHALFQTVIVSTAQHTDLLYPFIRLFNLRIDYDLKLMEPRQTPNRLCSQILAAIAPCFAREKPDLVLVQGDTTTAMAAALAAFHHRVPVGHIEAGLRSGDPLSPFPEEMNRQIITRLATYHFAATPHNRTTLIAEGVAPEKVFVTGNPVVDALRVILARGQVTPTMEAWLAATQGLKRIVLTTHRRESFGTTMATNLRVMRTFVEQHNDVALAFPVHPNPAVFEPTMAILSGHPRIHLLPPLNYEEFIILLSHAWLVVTDSGGVQEEAPTLGKPLLILRQNTERPEVVEAGVGRLVGGGAERLASLLSEAYQSGSWIEKVQKGTNPFGRGDSGERIVQVITRILGLPGDEHESL